MNQAIGRIILLLLLGLSLDSCNNQNPLKTRDLEIPAPTVPAFRPLAADPSGLVPTSKDAYNGAEIQSGTLFTLTKGQTYRAEWIGQPAAGKTAITLFSMFDQTYPWTEMGFETFGGAANGSWYSYQTQYVCWIKGAKKYHEGYHQSPNIFDGKLHTFWIDYTPALPGKEVKIVWSIDGKVVRTVIGGDANYLDNTIRIHAAAWKVRDLGGWGSMGTSPLTNITKAKVSSIKFQKWSGTAWTTLNTWTFVSKASLNGWILSNWTFWSFQGGYVPGNAVVENNMLSLILSKR